MFKMIIDVVGAQFCVCILIIAVKYFMLKDHITVILHATTLIQGSCNHSHDVYSALMAS